MSFSCYFFVQKEDFVFHEFQFSVFFHRLYYFYIIFIFFPQHFLSRYITIKYSTGNKHFEIKCKKLFRQIIIFVVCLSVKKNGKNGRVCVNRCENLINFKFSVQFFVIYFHPFSVCCSKPLVWGYFRVSVYKEATLCQLV